MRYSKALSHVCFNLLDLTANLDRYEEAKDFLIEGIDAMNAGTVQQTDTCTSSDNLCESR